MTKLYYSSLLERNSTDIKQRLHFKFTIPDSHRLPIKTTSFCSEKLYKRQQICTFTQCENVHGITNLLNKLCPFIITTSTRSPRRARRRHLGCYLGNSCSLWCCWEQSISSKRRTNDFEIQQLQEVLNVLTMLQNIT